MYENDIHIMTDMIMIMHDRNKPEKTEKIIRYTLVDANSVYFF